MTERRLAGWLLLVLLALVLAGAVWTPYDPAAQDFRDLARMGPGPGHWMGVDALGRDLGSRLWAGAGHTVALAGLILLLNFSGAVVLLMVERTAPPPVPAMVRTALRLAVAAPVLLIGLLLLVWLGPSPLALVLAAAVGNLPLTFRQMRVLWLEHRSAPHVQACEVLGGGTWHRFWFAIWPNFRPDLAALSRLVFAIAVLELSGLAFIGLMGDPDFPELGSILRQHQAEVFTAPWLVIAPALVLSGLLALVHASGAGRD